MRPAPEAFRTTEEALIAVPEPPPGPERQTDPFSGLQYHRLIDWPARLQREAPFLLALLEAAPEPSLLDLGCGTGEHAAYFARKGFRVVGLDRSPAQLELARRHLGSLPLRFVEGDLQHPGDSVHECFGSAFCLGNTLVHVQSLEALAATCHAVHALLLPGGTWVIQILNYARLLARRERSLPVQILPDDEGELVFLRLLSALPDRRMQFVASTLRWRQGAEPPLELLTSRTTVLRTWLQTDLEKPLRQAGFKRVHWYGDLRGSPFQADSSSDLVCVARR